jgi:hypothetical protein
MLSAIAAWLRESSLRMREAERMLDWLELD